MNTLVQPGNVAWQDNLEINGMHLINKSVFTNQEIELQMENITEPGYRNYIGRLLERTEAGGKE